MDIYIHIYIKWQPCSYNGDGNLWAREMRLSEMSTRRIYIPSAIKKSGRWAAQMLTAGARESLHAHVLPVVASPDFCPSLRTSECIFLQTFPQLLSMQLPESTLVAMVTADDKRGLCSCDAYKWWKWETSLWPFPVCTVSLSERGLMNKAEHTVSKENSCTREIDVNMMFYLSYIKVNEGSERTTCTQFNYVYAYMLRFDILVPSLSSNCLSHSPWQCGLSFLQLHTPVGKHWMWAGPSR